MYCAVLECQTLHQWKNLNSFSWPIRDEKRRNRRVGWPAREQLINKVSLCWGIDLISVSLTEWVQIYRGKRVLGICHRNMIKTFPFFPFFPLLFICFYMHCETTLHCLFGWQKRTRLKYSNINYRTLRKKDN